MESDSKPQAAVLHAMDENLKDEGDTPGRVPIAFILGILQRSGTNYLSRLISLHPDCQAATIIQEDYLLACSDPLVEYARLVRREWNAEWLADEKLNARDSLFACLGDGLLSFLGTQLDSALPPHAEDGAPRRRMLISKTPSVHNLDRFFAFFPHARLIILVRDGRDVVESGMRSFDWDVDLYAKKWASAARSILDFVDTHRSNKKDAFLLVKYEYLLERMELEMPRIMAFLGLDETRYDFAAARSLPVLGSSDLRKRAKDKVHWQSVEKDQNFNPRKRWKQWSLARHRRFNCLAGDGMKQLGYTLEPTGGNVLSLNLCRFFLNVKVGLLVCRQRLYHHLFGQ